MSAVAQPKGSEKTAIHPFHVNVPEAKLTELRKRISATRWPERETVTDESQGVQLATIQELARCWAADHYADPPQVQLRLATHASSLLVCRGKTGSKARR